MSIWTCKLHSRLVHCPFTLQWQPGLSKNHFSTLLDIYGRPLRPSFFTGRQEFYDTLGFLNETLVAAKQAVLGSAHLRTSDFLVDDLSPKLTETNISVRLHQRDNEQNNQEDNQKNRLHPTGRNWKNPRDLQTKIGFRLRPEEITRMMQKITEISVFEKSLPALKPLLDIFTDDSQLKELERKSSYFEEIDQNGISYAVGIRKRCRCKVWLKPFHVSSDSADLTATKSKEIPSFIVNDRPVQQYFKDIRYLNYVTGPFIATDTFFKMTIFAQISGEGLSAKAQALRHAISLALVKQNLNFVGPLDAADLLKTDYRRPERKKYGQWKARKKYQWCKR